MKNKLKEEEIKRNEKYPEKSCLPLLFDFMNILTFRLMHMKYRILFTFLLMCVAISLHAQSIPRVTPAAVGMDAQRMAYADTAIQKAIDNEEIPGAVLAVVRFDKLAYLRAYGMQQVHPEKIPMNENAVFDLASVSKVISTTLSCMILIEQGKLRLYDNVSLYIPEFKPWVDTLTQRRTEIKIINLLTHTSGLPAYASLEELQKVYSTPNPDGMIEYISNVSRLSEPRKQCRYSCLNFITLQRIIELISGQSLQIFARENIFKPLHLKHTDYNPVGETLYQAVPTEPDRVPTGTVHDPLARVMNGGVSGNAGVFSNAEDLSVLAAMLLNGGELNGVRILGPLTVRTMSKVPSGYEDFGRTLGWDTWGSNQGDLFGPYSYGHTGFTGTSIVLDPETKTAVILLTNCVHLKTGTSIRLRNLISNIVAGSIIELSE
ncbi:MAG: serine hydrolase [Bacteroidales bacterium]|jgi:CubicO group peptidase (beta-lactamase class C family)|nr:serine hydrolase [Bacteroidales bacterium]